MLENASESKISRNSRECCCVIITRSRRRRRRRLTMNPSRCNTKRLNYEWTRESDRIWGNFSSPSPSSCVHHCSPFSFGCCSFLSHDREYPLDANIFLVMCSSGKMMFEKFKHTNFSSLKWTVNFNYEHFLSLSLRSWGMIHRHANTRLV